MLICPCCHSITWVLKKSYIKRYAGESSAWIKQNLLGLPESSAVQVDFVSIVSPSHLSPQESLLADVHLANCAKVYGYKKRWGQMLCLASECAISTTLCISVSFIHPVINSSFSAGLGFHWNQRYIVFLNFHCSYLHTYFWFPIESIPVFTIYLDQWFNYSSQTLWL